MKNIISYLEERYNPDAIIIYGSYADGSNNLNSDFDALVITKNVEQPHDGSVIDGVLLDVYIYNLDDLYVDDKYRSLLQLEDSIVVLDKNGIGEKLQHDVISFIESLPKKSYEQNLTQVEWCEKMLKRTQRQDAEGYFRWHWLLTESLEIYFDICGVRYKGPKKSILFLQKHDPTAVKLYETALSVFSNEFLQNWISHLRYTLSNTQK